MIVIEIDFCNFFLANLIDDNACETHGTLEKRIVFAFDLFEFD